jgi:internalin A
MPGVYQRGLTMTKRARVIAVVIGLAAVLGVRADEESALKAVEKLGGKVFRDDSEPGKPITLVTLYGTQATDADLKELKDFLYLQKLILGRTRVTDAGLRELKDFQQLEHLYLAFTQVTDGGLKELKDLKNLRELHLTGTRVTDAGLKHLQDLNNLQFLSLTETRVTEAGVANLQKALPKCRIGR